MKASVCTTLFREYLSTTHVAFEDRDRPVTGTKINVSCTARVGFRNTHTFCHANRDIDGHARFVSAGLSVSLCLCVGCMYKYVNQIGPRKVSQEGHQRITAQRYMSRHDTQRTVYFGG